MSAATSEPLLAAADLRVDVDGVPACDGLTFRTTADRVLVLGGPRALFEATSGLRPVVRGALTVRGVAASVAVDHRVLAGAALDPPLPPKWTPVEYVTWSARLAGAAKVDAQRLAGEAISRLQLGAMEKVGLATLVPHARRAVVVAAALATGASVVAIEDPLAGLPEEVARAFARILVTALEGRPFVVFAPRLPLTSPLALAAAEAIVVSRSRVEAQGAPAEIAAAERRYVARVQGPVEALGAKLAERGGRLTVEGAQVLFDLGDSMTTADLLGMCLEAEVTVVELRSLARALA